MGVTSVIIMGAAGRDFHNFNVYFRNKADCRVVAFTATQIPGIEGRIYPASLAGPRYPRGIPIQPEEELGKLIKEHGVEQVVFSYSDVSHEYVMHKASTAIAAGADFRLMGPRTTMLKSKKPVISVCAVRTGSGKSQTSRRISEILRRRGYKVAVIRHPMPYGDLARQAVQRYEKRSDLDENDCTIEEREEYEPHIVNGSVVYAGVDYKAILRLAEKEADIIVWDGGNNDLPFIKPDLHIVVADPLRPGHEMRYHPGEANLRMANIIVLNKVDSAKAEDIEIVKANIRQANPAAKIVQAKSAITVDDPGKITGKTVCAVEDGPTVTHGEMPYGAAIIAANKFKASKVVDPRPYALGSIDAAYKKYAHLGPVLPALGYGENQIRELESTLASIPCDTILVGTPIDLTRILTLNKPSVRVRYELEEVEAGELEILVSSALLPLASIKPR